MRKTTARKRRNPDTAATPTTEIAAAETAETASPLRSVPRDPEFTVAHAAIKAALARLTNVVDKNSKLPILAHVALRAAGAELEMVGTDLDVWLCVRVPTGEGSSSFGTTVPAHKLSALVKTLSEGEIACSPGEGILKITSGKVVARVSAIPDRDFPKIPTSPETWTVADARVLRAAIEATMFSTCRDSTRFHMAGAFLESDGRTLTMVTTDGHRLTKVRSAWSWDGPSLASGIIVPQKGLQEMKRLLAGADTCEIARKGGLLFVRSGAATLIVKLTDAQFPPYDQVIPKDHTSLVTFASAPMVKALERAKLVTSETRGVCFEIAPGSLTVVCDNPEVAHVTEQMDADYAGKPMRWGVNPTYMLELLAEIDAPSITMSFGANELDPAIVRSTDDAAMKPVNDASILGVIMPMRI
jgi:DNA polymerase-3 subunit beta